MNRFARYAIYYAPRPEGELWRLASAWLGRDARSDAPVPRMAVPELEGVDLERLTASPRHYGFHATLRAPFEPVDNGTEEALFAAAARFARAHAAFDVKLHVAELGDFIALRPASRSAELAALHEDCLHAFDACRAPISEADVRRRRRSGLSAQQEAHLLRWGYPHVLEQFRFHMTLTGRIASKPSHKSRIREAIGGLFAPVLSSGVTVDGISVFGQISRNLPFRLLEWFEFQPHARQHVYPPARSAAGE